LKVDGRLEYSYDEWLINYPVLLSPGSHVIECVSKKAPRTKASKVVVVEDETTDMVTLRLKVSKRWKQDGEHLIDLQTNLRWTAQDNGIGLSWPQAQRYCQQLGDDWRLPTTAELLGIFDTTEIGIECPSSTCKVYSGFSLMTNEFWSSERSGPQQAWMVELILGRHMTIDYSKRHLSQAMGLRGYIRALCVQEHMPE
jgi:hypothetical protein